MTVLKRLDPPTHLTGRPPAVLGGEPRWPAGLPLARPEVPDVPRVAARIAEVLASGQLTNGAHVRELEARAADLCGVRHAVAVSSCTSGLMLVYQGVGVAGPVVIPSLTFAASPHAVVWAGGRPRWADVEPLTLNADAAFVRDRLAGAHAISATHLYGNPADVTALEEVARAAGLPLVLDAAHALGSTSGGRPIGGRGTAEVFSLSPTKVAPAGEGGLVTTDDDDLAEAVRLGRDYGNPGDYDCRFAGLNARMSELHAVVALATLEALPRNLARRQALVEGFSLALAGTPGLRVVLCADGDTSTYKDLTVLVDADAYGLDVPELTVALADEGVATRRYFYPACHQQRAYALLPRPYLPVTERLAPAVISLPLHPRSTEEEMSGLVEVLQRLGDRSAEVRTAVRGRTPEPRAAGLEDRPRLRAVSR